MQNLHFKYDLNKKIINTFFYILCSIYICKSGIEINNICFSLICFFISLFLLVNLFIREYCKRDILLDNKNLYLQILHRKKIIDLSYVSSYSLNDPTIDTIFCKSKENICLFYKGRKNYISIKRIEMIEKKLLELNIKKNQSVISLKTKKIDLDYILILFLISIMVYLINVKNILNFWIILLFLLTISIYILKLLLIIIQIKKYRHTKMSA